MFARAATVAARVSRVGGMKWIEASAGSVRIGSAVLFREFSASKGGKTEPYYNRSGRLVDPARPQQPKNAYAIFTAEEAPRVKSANPSLAQTEVIQKVAKTWREMSDAARSKYTQMAEKESAEYKKLMESYTPPDMPKKKMTKKERLEKNGPRRKSGYNLFVADQFPKVRGQDPSLGAPDVMKKVSEIWKGMSDAQKQEFNDRAERAA